MKKFYEAPELCTLAYEAEECLSVSGTEDDNYLFSVEELLGN